MGEKSPPFPGNSSTEDATAKDWRPVNADRAETGWMCVCTLLQDWCKATAVLLHYFFLAAFFLMLAEGVQMLLYIVFVFHTRRKRETTALIFGAWCESTYQINTIWFDYVNCRLVGVFSTFVSTAFCTLYFCLSYPTLSTKALCFRAVRPQRSSVVHADRSCYHDISWTAWAISMKLTVNIH